MSGSASLFAHSSTHGYIGLRRLSADLAVLTTGAAVLGLFLISPLILEVYGISYITPGGGIGSKFHPSTFLAILAFALRCLSTRRPLQTGWRLLTDDAGIVVMLTAVLVGGTYAAIIAKSPVTPFGDTFVLPVLCFLLLRDLDATLVKWLALLVACVLAANAVLGITEFLIGRHFVGFPLPPGTTSDPTRGDAVFDWRADLENDWRATALLGHPLVNGLIIGCFIMCLAARGARWLPTVIKAPLLFLECASMFAFGARTSLVFTIAALVYFGVQQCSDALNRGGRLTPRMMAVGLVAIAIGVGAVEILVSTGFFDRTIDRFVNDAGSAATRSTMFELFKPFSWSDLVLGPNQEVVDTWRRIYGLEFGIESSWVGLALSYGFLITSIIMIGIAGFAMSVVRASGRGAVIVIGFYLISISGTASLSGKTTSMAMAAVLVLLFLRKDERQLPLRSALGLEAA